MTRQLARAGYTVETATNGAEALSILQQRFHSLLVTDWDMPIMDGVALCKAVRGLPLEGYVYTILLTAREGKAHLLEALAAGADDFVTKPPDENELIARLGNGERILKLERSLRDANRRIYLLSITDALTGTFNRRFLMERLPLEIDRVRRHQTPFSVILCDIDHFKKINDAYGHQSGDVVLKDIAAILLQSVRKEVDWVCRYGGEEFLIALRDTPVDSALSLAESIRNRIAAHVSRQDRGPIAVSASFGVAGYQSSSLPADATMDSLMSAADHFLYQSKQSGRNCVTGPASTQEASTKSC
jgi:diguanylate cyclase (GGDEF)-like protein